MSSVQQEIRDAIAIVQDSRQTHSEWIGYLDRWGDDLRDHEEVAGGITHHKVAVANYDRVIQTLRVSEAMRDVLEELVHVWGLDDRADRLPDVAQRARSVIRKTPRLAIGVRPLPISAAESLLSMLQLTDAHADKWDHAIPCRGVPTELGCICGLDAFRDAAESYLSGAGS